MKNISITKILITIVLTFLISYIPVYAEELIISKENNNHYVKINYNANGGTMAYANGQMYSISEDIIYRDGKVFQTIIKYNNDINSRGLLDCDNYNWLNLVKKGYIIEKGKEWNTKPDGTGRSYDEAKIYKDSDFCDVSKNNCEITLYVNWIKNDKDKLTINKQNGKIYNEYGQEVNLQGVVLPNIDTQQFNAATSKKTLSALKNDLGINTVRISLSPKSNMDYTTAFYRIKKAIKNASEARMYIIFDWGVMSANVGDPRETLAQNNYDGVTTANNFFESIAKYSENNPYVLFEICNEPNVEYGTSPYKNVNTWNAVKEYADVIIPIIRKYSDNIVIVAGRAAVSLKELTNDPITKYDNIAYTFHLYPYNYKFEMHKEELSNAIDKKITLIMTEASIMNAALTENKNKKLYSIEKMDEYLNFFKQKNYKLNFMYFKFDFPAEESEYHEWSILKPINSKYYNTRCYWKDNIDNQICIGDSLYEKHMSNLNLNTKLSYEYFCSSNANQCSKDKGKGVYSRSGYYFVSQMLKKY